MESINQKQITSIYQLHYSSLKRYAFQFCQDDIIAEEAVQIVFSKLIEKENEIQIQSSLIAYIYRSIRNQTINLQKNFTPHVALNEEMAITEDQDDSDLMEEYLKKLPEAIKELPSQCRLILIKKRIENKSYGQIADEMGITSKTVENQMGIALKKLRAYFKNHLGEN